MNGTAFKLLHAAVQLDLHHHVDSPSEIHPRGSERNQDAWIHLTGQWRGKHDDLHSAPIGLPYGSPKPSCRRGEIQRTLSGSDFRAGRIQAFHSEPFTEPPCDNLQITNRVQGGGDQARSNDRAIAASQSRLKRLSDLSGSSPKSIAKTTPKFGHFGVNEHPPSPELVDDDTSSILSAQSAIPRWESLKQSAHHSGKTAQDGKRSSLRQLNREAPSKKTDDNTDAIGTTTTERITKQFHELDSTQMMRILFSLPEDEECEQVFSCWLVRTVLMKGYLYLTRRHLCFCASVPKLEEDNVIRSGFMKTRISSYQWKNVWCVLRGSILSCFDNSEELYYPKFLIDLRYTTDIKLLEDSSPEFSFKGFTLTTLRRPFEFRTDSELNLKEWYIAIKGVIFQTRSECEDFVRCVLPFSSVVDVKHSHGHEKASELPLLDDGTCTPPQSVIVCALVDDGQEEEMFFTYFQDTSAAYEKITSTVTRFKRTTPGSTPQASQHISPAILEPKPTTWLSSRAHPSSINSFLKDPPTVSRRRSSASNQSAPPSIERRKSDSNISNSVSKLVRKGTDAVNSTSKLFSPAMHKSWYSITPSWSNLSPLQSRRLPRSPPRALPDISRPSVTEILSKGLSSGISGLRKALTNPKEESKIRRIFGLSEWATFLAIADAYLIRVIPRFGRLYVTEKYILFYSRKTWGVKAKIPMDEISMVQEESTIFWNGMSLTNKMHNQIFFEFWQSSDRRAIVSQIGRLIGADSATSRQTPAERGASCPAWEDFTELEMRREFLKEHPELLDEIHGSDAKFVREPHTNLGFLPFFPGKPASTLPQRSPKSLRIVLLTIGTRGDVQPMVSLGKRLLVDGHRVKIATHAEYQSWIEGHGLEFAMVAGEPAEIMALCVDNGMFSVTFMTQVYWKFRDWLASLFQSSWKACSDAEVLIEHAGALSGYHIAERLRCHYFRAMFMPWSRTKAYPHPFAVPERSMGGQYNYMTYVLTENLIWRGLHGMINKFRKSVLGLDSIRSLDYSSVPFIYGFSPFVCPKPPEWPDWVVPCGYWFLDTPHPGWRPSQELQQFLSVDPKKVVYIGFGSIVVPDPKALGKALLDAVKISGVRCIIAKGWIDRIPKREVVEEDGREGTGEGYAGLNDRILFLDNVPHDWLFSQIGGVVHHGGSGTTAAGLRAGIPTTIKPFFGDQHFWASRVVDLRCGIWLRKLTPLKLAEALVTMVSDQAMISRAAVVGRGIRAEDGSQRAVREIYRLLDYSKSVSTSLGQRLHTR